MAKFIVVLKPTIANVNSATNVDFAVNSASDTVNTRRLGDIRGHVLNCLSFSALLLGCYQSDKAITSSWVANPSLGNSSIITTQSGFLSSFREYKT